MFLPALTLTLAYLGEYTLVMRSSLLDTMREDYLVLARAKGLRDVVVRNRHAVPNALLPVVTLAAINFGFVLSGAIAVETIFSWPGLGLATYEAINGPDLPMLQGLFLVFSAAVILSNLFADLLYAYLDPRVRDGMSTVSRPIGEADRVAAPAPRAPRPRGPDFRHDRAGMIGLVILVVFVAMALAAPLIVAEVRAAGGQRRRQPDLGVARASSRRSAPTTSAAASGRSSSGARGSACSSASPRR